jgi:hypothetical protein
MPIREANDKCPPALPPLHFFHVRSIPCRQCLFLQQGTLRGCCKDSDIHAAPCKILHACVTECKGARPLNLKSGREHIPCEHRPGQGRPLVPLQLQLPHTHLPQTETPLQKKPLKAFSISFFVNTGRGQKVKIQKLDQNSKVEESSIPTEVQWRSFWPSGCSSAADRGDWRSPGTP